MKRGSTAGAKQPLIMTACWKQATHSSDEEWQRQAGQQHSPVDTADSPIFLGACWSRPSRPHPPQKQNVRQTDRYLFVMHRFVPLWFTPLVLAKLSRQMYRSKCDSGRTGTFSHAQRSERKWECHADIHAG
ncbi:hypothetical protein BaRGS_00013753 [Batillaria attramentaria]|uniref:Uncharacterized protein n=1 Tax=Batillaria attramentaria TaxID=370345 RepID=A0ABD0L6L4_9CAEN